MTIRNASQARAAKAKGRQAEAAVVKLLREAGLAAERRRLTGASDIGDVGGVRGLVIEVKACKQIQLGPWLDEMLRETANANAKYPRDAPHAGLLVIKRRGHTDPREWYCCLRLDAMLALLAKIPGSPLTTPPREPSLRS